MSDLVVITFPNETDGPAALAALRDAQRHAGLALRDVAVVVKDASGKVNTHNETDSTTIAGGVGGGVIGLLLAESSSPSAASSSAPRSVGSSAGASTTTSTSR